MGSTSVAAITSSLGGSATFWGSVGGDKAGKFFAEDLESRGVDFCHSYFHTNGKPSARQLILEEFNGARSVANHIGCADEFRGLDVLNYRFSTIPFFLMEASLLLSKDAEDRLWRVCRHVSQVPSCKHAFNLNGITSWQDQGLALYSVINNAHIIFGSENEHVALRQSCKESAKREREDEQHHSRMVRQTRPIDYAVVSVRSAIPAGRLTGHNISDFYSACATIERIAKQQEPKRDDAVQKLEKAIRVIIMDHAIEVRVYDQARWGDKIHQVRMTMPDTVQNARGRNDAIIAGFLLAQARGEDIDTSLQWGASAATAICSEGGTRPSDPTPGAWAHLVNG
jgi:sugar/nucleoside kinase (ribokinase family)